MDNASMASEFCDRCGSVLPLPIDTGVGSKITCRVCEWKVDAKHFDGITSTTQIVFNARDVHKKSTEKKNVPDGPEIERKCKICGHDKQTYSTLQTRSADEGQTVFYTCVKCGAQENENS